MNLLPDFREGKKYPDSLRSIVVPLISLRECVNSFPHRFNITDKEICTHDRAMDKRCNSGDSGAPLVVNSRLVGVYSWSGETLGYHSPDVFMNVAVPIYRNWIMSFFHFKS